VRSFRPKLAAQVLLLALLAVVTLIVVLPEVDLLDTAFQRNTSPLALYSRFHSVPPVALSCMLFSAVLTRSTSLRLETREASFPALSGSLQALHHSFRC